MNKKMNIESVGRFFFLVGVLAYLYACDDPVIPDDGSGNIVGDIFSDSFESADMSTTNTDGFKWAANNRTSIVIQDPKDGPVAVYNNKEIYNVHSSTMDDGTTRDWTAKTGQYSLRFYYPAEQPWAEQRFDLGTTYRDIWIGFWLRVPTNFYHRDGPKNNKKLFSLFMDDYDTKGDGTTIIVGPWSDTKGGSVLNIGWSAGNYTPAGANGNKTALIPFITYPGDQGRWMHIIFHFKVSTTDSSNDGVVQMWRKWASETSYTEFANVINTNIVIPTAGPNGWTAGYVMGWTNPKYPVDTEWLMDDFNVSSQSLLN